MTKKKPVGRPPLSTTEPSVRLVALVPESMLAFVKEMGFGCISVGLRRIIDEARKSEDDRKRAMVSIPES